MTLPGHDPRQRPLLQPGAGPRRAGHRRVGHLRAGHRPVRDARPAAGRGRATAPPRSPWPGSAARSRTRPRSVPRRRPTSPLVVRKALARDPDDRFAVAPRDGRRARGDPAARVAAAAAAGVAALAPPRPSAAPPPRRRGRGQRQPDRRPTRPTPTPAPRRPRPPPPPRRPSSRTTTGTSPMVWVAGLVAVLLLRPSPSSSSSSCPARASDEPTDVDGPELRRARSSRTRPARPTASGIILVQTPDETSDQPAGTILEPGPAAGHGRRRPAREVDGHRRGRPDPGPGARPAQQDRGPGGHRARRGRPAAGRKTEAFDPTVPVGLIVSQNPAPGVDRRRATRRSTTSSRRARSRPRRPTPTPDARRPSRRPARPRSRRRARPRADADPDAGADPDPDRGAHADAGPVAPVRISRAVARSRSAVQVGPERPARLRGRRPRRRPRASDRRRPVAGIRRRRSRSGRRSATSTKSRRVAAGARRSRRDRAGRHGDRDRRGGRGAGRRRLPSRPGSRRRERARVADRGRSSRAGPATERRKCRQVPQAVEDRRQTQQRAVSAWGVPQCGQRHIGMRRMVVCDRRACRRRARLTS